MERLTSKRDWIEAGKNLSNEWGYSHIWRRLKQIEDILSDEYDLDRLRTLVEADRYGRCVVLPCKPSDATVKKMQQLAEKDHKEKQETVKRGDILCDTCGSKYKVCGVFTEQNGVKTIESVRLTTSGVLCAVYTFPVSCVGKTVFKVEDEK